MPKMPRLLLTAVTVVLLAVALPAAAETSGFAPDLRTERTYFVCKDDYRGQDKVQNQSNPGQWTTTAPNASYTSGAGCVLVDSGALHNPDNAADGGGDAAFLGTYTGNLSSLTVHMHDFDGVYTRANYSPGARINVHLEVDGEVMFSTTGLQLKPVPGPVRTTALAEFTITDLNLLSEADLTQHQVTLIIGTYYGDDVHTWAWGASEVPSGITFNPAQPSANVVSVRDY
jgi:hypothetical protein